MGEVTVDQIRVTPVQRISLDNGDVLHAMKRSDNGYVDFGEAYFSEINPGAIKAWKRHHEMTLNLVVPHGKVKFAFFDESNASRVETLGYDRYIRLTIPPRIWFGFMGISSDKSIILNIASIPHDPNEVERLPVSSFDYNWN